MSIPLAQLHVLPSAAGAFARVTSLKLGKMSSEPDPPFMNKRGHKLQVLMTSKIEPENSPGDWKKHLDCSQADGKFNFLAFIGDLWPCCVLVCW